MNKQIKKTRNNEEDRTFIGNNAVINSILCK